MPVGLLRLLPAIAPPLVPLPLPATWLVSEIRLRLLLGAEGDEVTVRPSDGTIERTRFLLDLPAEDVALDELGGIVAGELEGSVADVLGGSVADELEGIVAGGLGGDVTLLGGANTLLLVPAE